MSADHPKKSLGQHWLHDTNSLVAMAEAADVQSGDVVLEIGPGLGTLTEVLLARGAQVTAVEFDDELARELSKNILHRDMSDSPTTDIITNQAQSTSQAQQDRLQIFNTDILKFDLSILPKDYKVCANIPYYLTSNVIRRLLESENSPSVMALLIQKEVAERIASGPGRMSILAVATQFYAEVKLSVLVPAELFTPPPKVDSQIIQIIRRSLPLFPDVDTQRFFQIVRAGFSEKRKKLRSSLSGGLQITKPEVDEILKKAGISPDARAQELTLNNWYQLYSKF